MTRSVLVGGALLALVAAAATETLWPVAITVVLGVVAGILEVRSLGGGER